MNPPSSSVPSRASSIAAPGASRNRNGSDHQVRKALEDIRLSSPAYGECFPEPPQPVKIARPSMANRISRMFADRRAPPKEPESRRQSSSDWSADSAKMSVNGYARPSVPSRQPSTQSDRRSDPDGKGKEKDSAPRKRFEVLTDGSHVHHLKSAKRQEKLTDLLRLVGGGKRRDDLAEDQQLSLVSNWVDQMRSEGDRLDEERRCPNSNASLVDKYGKCQEVVGRGAFGIVRISHKVDPKDSKVVQLYAIKEFRRRPQETAKKYQKRLTAEFCISSSLRHPNVIHTLDLMQDYKGDYCEVMEYCAGGDLYTLVLAAGKLEVVEADCFFKQLMRGVEYMHEMGVAHRDLKPENLLLTTHGALKITDFGNGECFRMAWEKEAHMTAGLCGSGPYIAPEEYVDKEFDPRAVDVWATGVIYMAMRTGRHLWRVARKDEDEFYERYLDDRKAEDGYAPIETLHRSRCRNVIYSILDPNPGRRITASQVLKSEWVREIKLCKAGEEGY